MTLSYDRDISIVHIATAPNEAIALMWQEVLQEEGLAVLVRSGGSGFALGHNLLNEQYIFVREDQVQDAKQVLADFEEDDSVLIDPY